MKKFLKNITKKSKGGSSTSESPKLGAVGGSGIEAEGYDVREKDLPKLHKAAWAGDLGKVKQLVKKDTNSLDKENRTALHLASVRGHRAVVQELLEWGAKTNIGDNDSKTPLLKAVECNQEECVIILLDHRADINTSDRDGNTSLHIAISNSFTNICKLLIKKGAALNKANKEGVTPLHIASRGKKIEITRLLLEYKAAVDVLDNQRRTPLMYACREGSVSAVQLLLQFNANITIKDNKGFSAEDLAMMAGHHGCSQLISDHATRLRRSLVSGGSIPSTPRTPTGQTPRTDSVTEDFGIPMQQQCSDAEDTGDETSRMSNGAGDFEPESWAEDTDTYSGKPKINLAAALEKGPAIESEEGPILHSIMKRPSDAEGVKKFPMTKQTSNRSHTSVEEDWSDEEDSHVLSRKSNTPRVSFKADNEISETIELTGDEAETDEEEDGYSRSKKQKLDQYASSNAPKMYTPTGLPANPSKPISDEEHKVQSSKMEYNKKEPALMKQLGLDYDEEDGSDMEDDDIFEGSESASLPLGDGVSSGKKEPTEQKIPPTQHGILKKQKEEVLVSPKSAASDDVSEWDSDVEGMLDPERSERSKGEEESNWDSSASVQTPRDHKVFKVPHGISSLINQEVEEDEYENDDKDVDAIKKDNEDLMDSIHNLTQDSGGTIDSGQSGSGHGTIVTVIDRYEQDLTGSVFGDRKNNSMNAHSTTQAGKEGSTVTKQSKEPTPSKPLIAKKVDDDDDEEDNEESNWDSEDEIVSEEQPITLLPEELPPLPSVPPPKSPRVSSLSKEDADDDEDSTEPVSEWELERMKQKETKKFEEERLKQEQIRLVEEEEKLRQEEIARQEAWEQEEKRRQELEVLKAQEDEDEEAVQSFEEEDDYGDEEDGDDDVADKMFGERQEDFSNLGKAQHAQTSIMPATPQKASPMSQLQVQPKPQPQVQSQPVFEEVLTSFVSKESSAKSSAMSPEITSRANNSHREKFGFDQETEQPYSISTPRSEQQSTSKATASISVPPSAFTSTQPTFATASKMSLASDGLSHDEDSDLENDRCDVGEYLKSLPNTYSYKGVDLQDDDVLSFTSTENGDTPSIINASPYSKDVLASLNLDDRSTVVKLQEHLIEQRKQLDKEKDNRISMDGKIKALNKEKNDIQKRLDGLLQQKSSLEQSKLELEQKIRNLEYSLNEESEMRKNADVLLSKTKEQLQRKEEQYTLEMEAKQKLELDIRKLQMEIRQLVSSKKQLEDDKRTLQQKLDHEKKAREMLENMNTEHSKLERQFYDEQLKTTTQKTEAENRLGEVDDERKHTHDSLDKARTEITALRVELEKQRSRSREEISLFSAENEELQNTIEELKNEVKLSEDALAHASMNYSMQMTNVKNELNIVNSALEKERASKEKLEAQLESQRKRLLTKTQELEKNEAARSELERRLQGDEGRWQREIENKEKEVEKIKHHSEQLVQRLHATEVKLNTVDNELHVTSTKLMEKTNLLQQLKKDLEFYKSAQDSHDHNYKTEKELTIKLQSKVETLQEKTTSLQHENLTLKQQLESTQQLLADKAGDTSQERFASLLATIRADQEKSRISDQERSANLSDNLARVKDELRTSESRRTQLEQELSRVNRDYNEIIRKLSVAEASLEVTQKMKDSIEHEKNQLKLEIERLQQKYETAHEKAIESQAKVAEMVERLERSEQSNMLNSQQLLNSSQHMEAYSKTKEELEEMLQKLQVENVKLQAELGHEKQRAEMLQKDLQDSQRVRSSLEELCSNLKSAKAALEDKLGHELNIDEEQTTKTLLSQEIDTHKDAWEKEVVSRSKLGLRIGQYERQKQEALSHLEEEKRKLRKLAENKRMVENNLEAEKQKNSQLQQENANLKAYLKVAKKRLKEVDRADISLGNLNTNFDMERMALEDTLEAVKSQLKDLQHQLEEEADDKAKIQAHNLQLRNELGTLKRLEITVKKLEKGKANLEKEYLEYKSRVENGYVDKEQLTEARKEIEARYRADLNKKLEDVNNYLETQAMAREKMETSWDEAKAGVREKCKRLQEENTELRIKCEQAVAQRESKEMEAKRFRDLYESEMQWRLRLSEQLMKSTDRAMGYKTKLVVEKQKNRIHNNLSTSMNGSDDMLGNRLKAELDRSIAKHLEAAPHDYIKPMVAEDISVSSNFAKSNADYLEVLKKKYCV